jgi:hypothetical protein
LLLGLLARYQAGWKRRALCDLPVACYRLGAPGVPAHQALRALATWARQDRGTSPRVARSLARELLEEIRVPRRQRAAWNEIVEVVTDALHQRRSLETEPVRAAAAHALQPLQWGRPPRQPGPSDEILGAEAVIQLMDKIGATRRTFGREELTGLGRKARRIYGIPNSVETGDAVTYVWATIDGFLAQLTARVEALAQLEHISPEELEQTRLPIGSPPSVAAVVASDLFVTGACLGLITTLGFNLLAIRNPHNAHSNQQHAPATLPTSGGRHKKETPSHATPP